MLFKDKIRTRIEEPFKRLTTLIWIALSTAILALIVAVTHAS
jgi:hypothetical protein